MLARTVLFCVAFRQRLATIKEDQVIVSFKHRSLP